MNERKKEKRKEERNIGRKEGRNKLEHKRPWCKILYKMLLSFIAFLFLSFFFFLL
jgi:hypothetical protein